MAFHDPVEIDSRDSRAQFTRLPLEEALANPDCRLAIDLWQVKRAGRVMPARADFDPVELKPILPRLILIDVISDPPDFRYRLAGTMSRDLRGVEVTGHSVLDLVPQQHGLRLWNDLCEMQRERAPQYLQISVIASTGEPMSYRVLRLPLGADGETMDMAMVLQDYGNALPLLRKYFDEARGGGR
ncbi:PAS domain-containing protein [Ferrovibrio terrae]|uniref:PAS domain-containing protein n=1 Tax=Ferrovibrio terrae TaxID=2594003 RepID=A0A516H6E5_9PROT|nr:PAS domain-containing protein [Ferrovibrio terrae]QDO99346.1 PAS domain-containing protein [Ferrovibrio terrae]